MQCTIYKIKNTITNECYIGQTTQDIRRRMSDHCNFNKDIHKGKIKGAIYLYGKENFTIMPIVICEKGDEADFLEQECIRVFKTLYPNGYNLQSGGKNAYLHPLTKEKLGDITRGRILSDEHKQKISASNKGIARRLIPIRCNETGRAFRRHIDVCKEYGISLRQMHRLLISGKQCRKGLSFTRIGKDESAA